MREQCAYGQPLETGQLFLAISCDGEADPHDALLRKNMTRR